MDYQALYQQKLTTADEAVKVVKSGDWVDYTWCTNHPIALDKALAARQNELTDVKVRGGVTMWMPEIAKAEDCLLYTSRDGLGTAGYPGIPRGSCPPQAPDRGPVCLPPHPKSG